MLQTIARTTTLLAVALAVAACAQVAEAPPTDDGVIVVTAGSAAPAAVGAAAVQRLSQVQSADPSIGGSSSAPVSLPGDGCGIDDAAVPLTITYRINGTQELPASFDIYDTWTFDGTTFVGSNVATVNVPAASSGSPRTFPVDVTVANASASGSGTATIAVTPFNLVTSTSGPGGQPLTLGAAGTATIHVRFDDCVADNTAPYLTLPADLTAEATSSSGAAVTFEVSAGDAEDGSLSPTCLVGSDPVASGATFPIGATEVACSVTDSGGLSTSGSFFVYVQDTTAPVFTAFPSDTTLVATSIDGLSLDLSAPAFTITAMDYGPLGAAGGEVSPPVTVTCTIDDAPAHGFSIAIGQTATVTCVASDDASYRAPIDDDDAPPSAPNVSAPATFDVTVTLDVSDACGFEPPLRMAAPFSAHRLNSTVPHKVCPPRYADGTLATDLASGLRLVLSRLDGAPATEVIEADDFAAGSTAWRLADGRYMFNLKTERTWTAGQYDTTVSYNGVVLATTELALRR